MGLHVSVIREIYNFIDAFRSTGRQKGLQAPVIGGF